jgi:hypothetical protein
VNNIFEQVFGGFLQAIGWMLGMAAVSVFVGVIALMTKGLGLILLPVLGCAAFMLWSRYRQSHVPLALRDEKKAMRTSQLRRD